MIKRMLDILVSLVGLLLLSPLIIVVAVSVRIFLGAPVLFMQERPGLLGKPFSMIKFRTMLNEKDINGELLSDSERLTKFGKFLRSTSLDELPELLNVLKGEMSIVGPRPLLKEYLPLYSKQQFRRHEVKPGITGWAQVNGRNTLSWNERFLLDVWYVDNHSLMLDFKIILRTLKKVIYREGISEQGEATMSKFTGSNE